MNWMEVALLLLGVGAFVASFVIPEKVGRGKKDELQVDTELLKRLVEKEMQQAKQRVSEVIDETLEYAVEKTERASERISNEKIMAISDYSETVLADMNKTHQEVMFLYDMLNDKHKNLKETVKIVDKQAKEAEEKANAAATALAAKEEVNALFEQQLQKASASAANSEKAKTPQPDKKVEQRITLDMIQPAIANTNIARPINTKAATDSGVARQAGSASDTAGQAREKVSNISASGIVNDKPVVPNVNAKGQVEPKNVEVYSFAAQAPRVEKPVQREKQAQELEKAMLVMQAQQQKEQQAKKTEPIPEENNNDKILRLHKAGYASVDIAKELGLGVGEVKLVINLFKGAV